MEEIIKIETIIKRLIDNANKGFIGPYNVGDVKKISNTLMTIALSIKSEDKANYNMILIINEKLFFNNFNINLFQLGRLDLIIRQLKNKDNTLNDYWNIINIKIKDVCKSRFEDGYYADAVESAFKEINTIVKRLYLQKNGNTNELDGANLMHTVFSDNNPILEFTDRTSESGRNIQKGYMEIFAGAMVGIRNPKAHENTNISKEDAIHKIFFASLLMNKVDQAVEYDNRQKLLNN